MASSERWRKQHGDDNTDKFFGEDTSLSRELTQGGAGPSGLWGFSFGTLKVLRMARGGWSMAGVS